MHPKGILRRIRDWLLSRYIRATIAQELDPMMRAYLRHNLPRQYSVYGDEERLEIAPTAVVNNALFNLSSGRVRIEDYGFFGHNVSILTGTHDYHKFGIERQTSVPDSGRDVLIQRGAWLASNVTVLGPCVIGEHAVVGACSLVDSDVPPYAIVAGIPAKVVGTVSGPRVYEACQD